MSTIKANAITHSSGTGGVDVQATNTNDAAASTDVGYEIISTVVAASAVSLVSTTAKTITSIDVPPGQWEMSGNAILSFAGTPVYANGAINTTTNTLPAADTPVNGVVNTGHNVEGNTINEHCPIPPMKVSLDATTTYYLIARASFSSTANAFGWIRAIRPR